MGKPTWNTLSLDESLALRTAATRLALEFSDVFGTETIDRFLHSSFDQFASTPASPSSCHWWPSGSPANGSMR